MSRASLHGVSALFLLCALLVRGTSAASSLLSPPIRSGVFPPDSNLSVHVALPHWLLAGEGVLRTPKLAVDPADRAQLEAEYKANCHSWENSREDVYFYDTFLKDLPEHGGFYVELGTCSGAHTAQRQDT